MFAVYTPSTGNRYFSRNRTNRNLLTRNRAAKVPAVGNIYCTADAIHTASFARSRVYSQTR